MFRTYTLKIYLYTAANYVLSLNGCVSCMQIDVCVVSVNCVISKVLPYILFLVQYLKFVSVAFTLHHHQHVAVRLLHSPPSSRGTG